MHFSAKKVVFGAFQGDFTPLLMLFRLINGIGGQKELFLQKIYIIQLNIG